jgi:peroxiredoxin
VLKKVKISFKKEFKLSCNNADRIKKEQMIYLINRLIKPSICIALIVNSVSANAQISLLQNTIDKLGSYKNYSYDYVYKQKEAFSDTLTINEKYVLLKVPEEKVIGYFFKHEYKYGDMKVSSTDLYSGTGLISLNPADSTYNTNKIQTMAFERTLAGELNWMKTFAKKNPSKIVQSADTIFNSIDSYHLILNTRDTTVGNDHLYTRIHLLIDKVTGLPVCRFSRSRTADFGKETVNYYSEGRYFNYKIDQVNINAASFAIPAGFHQRKKPREQTRVLTPGMMAPDWTLYSIDGEETSLSKMKGKIVLIDFFFVGCVPCMYTLAPLDRIYEKYKDKDVVILSISTRDNKELVTAFQKVQLIKNQMFPGGGDVANLYHVTSAPTVYLIDKEGKIASVITGYADDFEKKVTSVINSLFDKP